MAFEGDRIDGRTASSAFVLKELEMDSGGSGLPDVGAAGQERGDEDQEMLSLSVFQSRARVPSMRFSTRPATLPTIRPLL